MQIQLDKNKLKGNFQERAIIAQQFKNSIRLTPKWDNLTDDKKEALDGIMEGLSDILNGDPDQEKSWQKIEIYSKFILEDIHKRKIRDE